MNQTPKVSVVISTYNRASMLKRAIQSVLAQTFQDFELIVVDNASTDNTQKIVKSFSDERLRYICHAMNRGGSAARNTGIKNSKGQYIAFLDDDDEWFSQKLEKQVKKMDATPLAGLIYVGSEVFNEKKQNIEQVYWPQFRGQLYKRLLLSTIFSSVSNVLIRQECFQKVGLFDEGLTSCQDWEMWLRIACEYEFDFVPEILLRINVHEEHISTNYQSLIPGRTRMVQKHYDEFKKFPSILVVHLKRLGKLHCINGTYKEAWPWFQQAGRIQPLEWIKIMAWCLIELPWIKLFSPAKDFKRYQPYSIK